MDTNTRQIALSVLENLREDLTYARLNNGSRVLEVADLRQYIYEQMGRIRTAGLAMDGLHGNDNGHGQDILKGNVTMGERIQTKPGKSENNTESGPFENELSAFLHLPGGKLSTWARTRNCPAEC